MNIYKMLRSIVAQIRTFNRPARLFLLSTVAYGLMYAAWTLFFNLYLLERGFNIEFLGKVNSAPGLAALLLGVPLGLLSDRVGYKSAMLLGAGVSVTAMSMQVTLQSPDVILLMAFLTGVGTSLYYLSQAPFMMKVSGVENRSMLFSLNFALVPLAGVIGSALAGQLPALFGGMLGVQGRSAPAYQAVLLTGLFVGGGAILFFLGLIPYPHAQEAAAQEAGREAAPVPTDKSEEPFWRVLSRPLTVRLSLPNLLSGLGAALLLPYMNVFFVQRFAISDQTLGFLFGFSELLTGLGSVLAPGLALSLGSKISAVVITQAGSLIFLALMGFIPIMIVAAIGFLARGTLMNMAAPLFDAFAMEQVPEYEQATVNSVKNLTWNLGWAVGPYLSGVIQQLYGFNPIFILTGILYAASVAVTWILFHNRERPSAKPAVSAL
jgi:MFS family permease